MARVFLIRHGEPSAHWSDGANDPGLSARGYAQAEAAAMALAPVKLAVVSSPLLRCKETAAPLARMARAAPAIEPRVAEVPAPSIADRRLWLRQLFPGAVTSGAASPGWEACGAAIIAWRAGVVASLCALEGDTAVFTHFIAINAAVSAALGRDETIVCRPEHASITELACENGVLRLVRFGAQVEDAPA